MSFDGLTKNLALFSRLIKDLGPYGFCGAILMSRILGGAQVTSHLVVEAAGASAIAHVTILVALYVGSKIEKKMGLVRSGSQVSNKSEELKNPGSSVEGAQ